MLPQLVERGVGGRVGFEVGGGVGGRVGGGVGFGVGCGVGGYLRRMILDQHRSQRHGKLKTGTIMIIAKENIPVFVPLPA